VGNDDKDPAGPVDWHEEPIEQLARELRETVGAEFRAEAEISEIETEIQRARKRTAAQVAREAANHGDRISVVTRDRTITGELAHVGRDYLTVHTPTEIADARIDAVVLTFEPRRSGGIDPRGGSVTFKARLSEFEQTRETVEVVAQAVTHTVRGVIQVVASDHVMVRDADGVRAVIPIDLITLVLRPRSFR
jgi:hypothetical protein